MSTAIPAAFAAIRQRATGSITLPLYWQHEENILPDDPAACAYVEIVADRGAFIEIGGGRGSNRFRNRAELNIYVLVPRGQGLEVALGHAETIAALFRSWRASGVSFEGASVHPVGEGEALTPPGLNSAAGNYAGAVVSAPFTFDQVG